MDETDKRLVSKLSFVLDKFVNGYRPKDDTFYWEIVNLAETGIFP